MSKVSKQLEELAEAGAELLAVAIPEYGRGWNYLEDKIKVYKAENSNHSAFQIDGLEVQYFNPTQYELCINHLANLGSYIKRVQAETARIIDLVDGKSKAEREAEKAKRLAVLQQEIDELTKGD